MTRTGVIYCAAWNIATHTTPSRWEDVHETHHRPNDAGMMTHQFYAFNTIIILQAYADAAGTPRVRRGRGAVARSSGGFRARCRTPTSRG